MVFYVIVVLWLSSFVKAETKSGGKPLDTSKELTRIAFGSCYGAHREENPTIINSIADYKPDIFVWLGDVQYIDRWILPYTFRERDEAGWRQMFADFK
jgi:hypothetical protein